MADKNMNAKISVNFEESASRQSLNSGDSLPTLFGKIKKFLNDLNPVAFTGVSNNIHYGTTEYWNSQPSLIGEQSHIYVYTDYTVVNNNDVDIFVPNIKIGDGNAYLIDNPFITTSVEKLINLHINDTIQHITAEERTIWNNKIRCYLSENNNETIVFTTN